MIPEFLNAFLNANWSSVLIGSAMLFAGLWVRSAYVLAMKSTRGGR